MLVNRPCVPLACTDSSTNSLGLTEILDRTPLTVTPQTLVAEAIGQMGQADSLQCDLDAASPEISGELRKSDYVLVVEELRPVGILTQRDMVRLSITGMNFSQEPIAQVMTQPLITLTLSSEQTTQTAFALFQQFGIRHLPVVDEQGQLLGIVTRDRICESVIAMMQHQLDLQSQELHRAVRQLEQETVKRQQIDAALQESQQQLQTVVNQTFQFIGLLSLDGTLLDANQTALEFVGTTLAEVVGQPFWLTPWWTHDPAQQKHLQAAIAQTAAGEFVRREFTHRSARGTIEMFDFSIKPVFNDAGQVISFVVEGRNIQDRKRMEQQLQVAYEELEQQVADRTQELLRANLLLQESEHRYMSLVEASPVGLFWLDAAGQCTFVNDRWSEMTGISTATAMGQGWWQTIYPDDQEPTLRARFDGERVAYATLSPSN